MGVREAHPSPVAGRGLPAALRAGQWPWWVQVLAVYAATRLWGAVVLGWAAAGQADSFWGPGPPDHWTFVGVFWDASWYRTIALEGYPTDLPTDPDGTVQQNAWAFFPLFPLLVRLIMTVVPAPWEVVAPLTAVVLGALAMLAVDRVVHTGALARGTPVGRRLPLGTVLVVCLFPAAPVLQIAYTESASLLLVALTLLALVRRAYGWAVPAVLALGFTRAVALPMAVVVAVHLLVRIRAHRAGGDALAGRDVVRIGVLGAAAVLAGLAWPALCGLVTGVPDAYLRTQAAWRGSFSSAPVEPWLQMAQYLAGPPGLVLLVLVLGAVAALGLSRPARAAGSEVQAWGLAYPAWLVLVAFPQTSLIRFLLLAFPLGMATVGLLRSRAALAVAAVVLAAGQAVWVVWLWQLNAPTAWPP